MTHSTRPSTTQFSYKMLIQSGKTTVIIVLLSIAVVIGTHWTPGSVTNERIATVSEEVDSLVVAIDIYREREASYPGSLAELVERGYVERLPSDPWGVPYNYSMEQPLIVHEDQPFYVWTLGRDNRVGGEGPDRDVGNW